MLTIGLIHHDDIQPRHLHGINSYQPSNSVHGVGFHVIYSVANVLAVTIAIPGTTVTIHFDGISERPNRHFKSFIEGNIPKYGLHLQRLACIFNIRYGYKMRSFGEINHPDVLDHGNIEHCFALLPEWKRPVQDQVLLEAWEWQALRVYESLDRRHLHGSACLAEMAHWIGRECGYDRSGLMKWDFLEENFPDTIPLLCAMAIQSNGITRSQPEGEEIDYVSYSIGEVRSIGTSVDL
jgi:hypothetical protein